MSEYIGLGITITAIASLGCYAYYSYRRKPAVRARKLAFERSGYQYCVEQLRNKSMSAYDLEVQASGFPGDDELDRAFDRGIHAALRDFTNPTNKD